LLTWLLQLEPRSTAYAKDAARAFHAGQLLLGRLSSDGFVDAAGRRILAKNVRGATVPVLVDHRSAPLGVARVIPRQRDVLAFVTLNASPSARFAARRVAAGDCGLSIRGDQSKERPGGWREGDPFTVEEVSLVASPQDPSCLVVNLNHPQALRFLILDLGLSEKELCA